jgi:hypothetical protein
MPESYREPFEQHSMEAPILPQPPERRFQFSLRALLAYMFGAAIVATGVRYLLQLFEPLPNHPWIAASNVFFVSLAFGTLLYYFVRAPYLVDSVERFGRRWRQLQDHRRALDRWSCERRQRHLMDEHATDQADSS